MLIIKKARTFLKWSCDQWDVENDKTYKLIDFGVHSGSEENYILMIYSQVSLSLE